MENKKELRKRMISLREKQSQTDRKRWSRQIVDYVLQWDLYRQADTLALFLPFGHEVDIAPLVDKAVEAGKTALIPKVDKEANELRFYCFTDWDQLVPGPFGIREPDSSRAEPGRLRDIQLIVTPGLAFDRYGGRLGYGGGFYDRFFSRLLAESGNRLPPRAGVGFEIQVVERIPMQPYDVPITHLITEKGIASLAGGSS